MFRKIKDKILEKKLNDLFKFLETADYFTLKHSMLKMKWDALKENDNDTYELAGVMYNILEDFEKFFQGGNK